MSQAHHFMIYEHALHENLIVKFFLKFASFKKHHLIIMSKNEFYAI